MATRILMSDVEAFVRDTLLQIRAGLAGAIEQGVSTEMPEEVAFTLEIITAPQSMEQVTETESNETANSPTKTTTESEATDTTEETFDNNEVIVEAAAEDTENTTRATSQSSGESGSDRETINYTYAPLED